jgi:uncharacterized protein (TIGR02266 family)
VPREQRIITSLRVEYPRIGERVVAASEDISLHGVFVRTDQLLPVGDVVTLALHLPDGSERLEVISRVAHLMSERAARALGRHAGMGFEFLEQDQEHRERLERFLEALIEELTPPPSELPAQARVVVADGEPRLLERLSTALGDAGFNVEAVLNGAEAYSACLNLPPALVLCGDVMPVMDGWTLIKMLAARPRLAEIPVALMSDDQSDITRLKAYRLGVKDFIQRPFTEEELCIRLRRLAAAPRPGAAERSTLRGNLAEIGLGTLLSLLEFERKSGILAVLAEEEVARIFLAGGRPVKVESSVAALGSREKLMRVLSWQRGNFEFTTCEVVGSDDVKMSSSALLLEHARRQDESGG